MSLVNETLRTNLTIDKENNVVLGTKESEYWTTVLITCLMLNLFFVFIQTGINYFMLRTMGLQYLQRGWTWVDGFVLIISLAICGQYIALASNNNEDGLFEQTYEEY